MYIRTVQGGECSECDDAGFCGSEGALITGSSDQDDDDERDGHAIISAVFLLLAVVVEACLLFGCGNFESPRTKHKRAWNCWGAKIRQMNPASAQD
jgi:hypothetical protein